MEQMFVNAGYILMFAALAMRDVLWLRALLAGGQLGLFAYGCRAGLPPVMIWNAVFVVLNVAQILRLVRERRPVQLPPDLEDLHRTVFNAMTTREFLNFWETGSRRGVIGEHLIRDGERQRDLALVIDGAVRVVKDGREVAKLARGSFIAEMSFITGEPASADVIADGPAKIIGWDQEKLHNLAQINPALLIKLQKILGEDLTRKIRSTTRRPAPAAR